MRYLALALYAEGPADREFLRPVILRSVTELSSQVSEQPVEIAEQFVQPLPRPKNIGQLSRPERVEKLFGDALDTLDLLFIHTDGKGDPASADKERIVPCRDLLYEKYPKTPFACVGVVPVYETEAWAIADTEAIRLALGTTKSAAELGLPGSPQRAEQQKDPKAVLQKAYETVHGKPRSGRSRPSSLFYSRRCGLLSGRRGLSHWNRV